jgi:hypothetical protein
MYLMSMGSKQVLYFLYTTNSEIREWLTPVSGLAKILGIDSYVANIISHAVRKVVDQHT